MNPRSADGCARFFDLGGLAAATPRCNDEERFLNERSARCPCCSWSCSPLFGVGYYNREPAPSAVAVRVEQPATMGADHSPWARACEARLAEAVREFEAAAGFTCTPGTVSISTLSSGVDYVEYTRAADDGVFQVAITEEPDDAITAGWHGAPGPHGYSRGFEVIRHEHGRLGTVSARSAQGFLFAQHMEPAANFCIEQAP